MSFPEKKLFKVVITAIVVKNGKYLVTQRSPNEDKFPSRWTVPGGKLTTKDYTVLKRDTPHYWYNVLERALKREVKEEAGIAITNICYITSLADAQRDSDPSIVISCLADYAGGTITLDTSMSDYRWVTLKEAKKIDLIEGIYEELRMADQMLRGKSTGEWSRKK